MRLLDHLVALGLSPREARDALRNGKVLLGATPVADAGRSVDPAMVRVRPDAPRAVVGRDPVVVHRDRFLAVVWKPSGMLAVPAPGRREASVVRFVERLFGAAHAVHRLDEGTSGLMMVALDPVTQQALKDVLERHDVERRYLALVRGAFPPGERVMDAPIVRDRGDGLRGVGPGGRAAVTHFRSIERLTRGSLVEARLETGRTHQVRVHLAALGHPVLGDTLYGDGRGAPRLALHAAVLGFRHPRTGEALRFDAPLPDDLERLRH